MKLSSCVPIRNGAVSKAASTPRVSPERLNDGNNKKWVVRVDHALFVSLSDTALRADSNVSVRHRIL